MYNPNCFNRVSWVQLTRYEMPNFVVKNRPLLWENGELPVGAPFPGSDKARTRMLYEQHRIGVAPEATEPQKPVKKTKKAASK